MQGFRALGQFGEVAVLQGFRKRVEQAPDVAPLKGIMTGLAPFMKHFGDQAVGAHADIGRPDDQVVGFRVGDLRLFVGRDAFVLIVPFGEQEANGATDELGQVADDEPSVFAGEFDLTTKGEVVAYEHTGTGNDTCGELLVVAVPKSKNPAIVVTGFLGMDFHEAKIPHSIMGQAMSLGADAQTGGFEGLLDRGDELVMRDGAPGGGWVRCRNLADLLQIDVMSATVQDQVWGSTWRDDGGLEFKFGNHGFEVGLRMGGLPTRRACTSRGGAGPSLEGGVVGEDMTGQMRTL